MRRQLLKALIICASGGYFLASPAASEAKVPESCTICWGAGVCPTDPEAWCTTFRPDCVQSGPTCVEVQWCEAVAPNGFAIYCGDDES
jgi:hypothetical protein